MQDKSSKNNQSSGMNKLPPQTANLTVLTQIQNNLLKNFLDNRSHTLTYQTEIALQDIELKSCYVLKNNLLQNTTITPNIRAKIRSFILEVCSKQLIPRDVAALACTYVDLYFQKKGFCLVKELQIMAISCLMLARKQQQGLPPKICYQAFNKDIILRWETKVAKMLQYRLFPPTHFTFGQHVVKRWNLFTLKQMKFQKMFTKPGNGANLILRRFYEQLDCLHLVLQTFKWELQNVILNMFYLHAYLLNVPHTFKVLQLSKQQFLFTFYSEDVQFKLFFEKFLQSYSKIKKFSLSAQLGLYLKMFLGLNPTSNQFAVMKSLCVWDKIQTYNLQAYEIAKTIMQRISQ